MNTWTEPILQRLRFLVSFIFRVSCSIVLIAFSGRCFVRGKYMISQAQISGVMEISGSMERSSL